MIEAVTLVAVVAIWGLGWLVLTACERGPRAAVEAHSLALLLGLTAWAFVLTAVGHVAPIASLAPGLAWGVASVCGLAGGWCALRARGARLELEAAPGRVEGWLERCAVGVALVFLAFAVFYTATMPVHIFDPVFHFAFKGKLLFHEGLMGPGWTDVDGPIGRVITHPDYPPGVGALECLVAWPKGAVAVHAARPLFALFVLATGGFLWGRLRARGPSAAALGLLVWASLPFLFYSRLPHPDWAKGFFGLLFGSAAGEARFGSVADEDGVMGRWTQPDGWTLDGAGDLPLAALFSVGAWLLFTALQAKRSGARADLWIAGILLGGGALMKNEGLALLPVALLAAGIAWLVAAQRPPLARTALRAAGALGLALAVASPWLLVRGSVPTIGEDYPSRLTPAGLAASLASEQPVGFRPDGELDVRPVPAIVARGFVEAITHIPRFGLLWIATLAALAVRWRTLLRPRAPTAATAAAWTLLGAFALYAVVLVVTPWNLAALFKTAIPDRLIFHVAPLAILVLVDALSGPAERKAPEA